jgi:hypothetical protein
MELSGKCREFSWEWGELAMGKAWIHCRELLLGEEMQAVFLCRNEHFSCKCIRKAL